MPRSASTPGSDAPGTGSVRGSEPVVTKGAIPPRAVVIPGSLPKRFAAGEFGTPCALIIGERSAVATAADNLALTRESYSAGNSGVLQVLEAERQNQQARIGLVRAQSQRLQDTVQLLLALGGGVPVA